MSIPKPKHCGQNWLDMKPAEGGRVCGGCNKLIVDFTKSTWREIEEVQQANNNAVCGMYTDKQLQHWGQQPPTASCSKIAASLALFASLASVTPADAQILDSSKVRTIVHGRIIDEANGEPLADANIMLNNTRYGVISDLMGYYSIDITDYIDTLDKPTLQFKYVGMEDVNFKLKDERGDILYNPVLSSNSSVIAFYVAKPKLKDKLKHKLKPKQK